MLKLLCALLGKRFFVYFAKEMRKAYWSFLPLSLCTKKDRVVSAARIFGLPRLKICLNIYNCEIWTLFVSMIYITIANYTVKIHA